MPLRPRKKASNRVGNGISVGNGLPIALEMELRPFPSEMAFQSRWKWNCVHAMGFQSRWKWNLLHQMSFQSRWKWNFRRKWPSNHVGNGICSTRDHFQRFSNPIL